MNFYKYIMLVFGLPKTIYINFKYFKFTDAIKLPIILSNKVYLKSCKGEININYPIMSGLIKIGFGDVGIFDKHVSRTIFDNNGTINFTGKTEIGHGSKLSVSGNLTLGNNFQITAESTIICREKIVIGNNCLFSWENLIMDTDFHTIKDVEGNILNKNKKIIIGNNVWIGCRCTILKGSIIENDVVIASNSCIHSHIKGNNQIIGSEPIKVLRKDIFWEE